MIKKRKYKRRNPKIDEIPLLKQEINALKWHLYNAILYGEPLDLVRVIQLTKLGFKDCKDCDSDYELCKCEFCEECKLNSCLCNLNINREDFGSYKVSRVAWEYAKELFNIEYLKELRKEVLGQTNPGIEYKKMEQLMK